MLLLLLKLYVGWCKFNLLLSGGSGEADGGSTGDGYVCVYVFSLCGQCREFHFVDYPNVLVYRRSSVRVRPFLAHSFRFSLLCLCFGVVCRCGFPIETYRSWLFFFCIFIQFDSQFYCKLYFSFCSHSCAWFCCLFCLNDLLICLVYFAISLWKFMHGCDVWCGFHSTLNFRFSFDCKRSVI